MGSLIRFLSIKAVTGRIVSAVVRVKFRDKREDSLLSPAGIDAPPLPEDQGFAVGRIEQGRIAMIGNLMISQGAKPGELILYSRDSNDNIKSKLYLNQSGEFVFADGTDYAVAFEDLKTAFDELKSAFNTHTHAVTTAPGTTATALPQSAANIDLAKVEEVRVP